ncbi:MAG: hypothetical protein ACRC4M_01255 [Mycoplasma sp.]
MAKYFRFKEEMKRYDIDLGKGVGILAFSTPRNTGKTTSIMKTLMEWYEEKGEKFLLIRMLGEQVKKQRATFNEEWRGQYRMSESKIFKQSLIEGCEPGKEKYNEVEIATMVNITSAGNFKSSGNYSEYSYAFFDEFNDVRDIPNLYEDMVDLLITFQRNKDHFWLIMAGNKDSENNTFLVNWGIEPEAVGEEDRFYDLSGNIEHYYIDYSIKTFTGTQTKTSIGSHLAGFNEDMDRYVNNGGFKQTGEKNIVNYNLRIRETDQPKWNLIISKTKFILGEFIDRDGVEKLYIRKTDNLVEEINTFSMGMVNGINESNSAVVDTRTELDIAKFIYSYSRENALYYTSYDGKLIIDRWMERMLKGK